MPEPTTQSAPASAPAPASTLIPGAPAAVPGSAQPTASNGSSWSWASADGALSDGWREKLPDGLGNEGSLKVIDSLPNLAKSYVEARRMIGKKLEMPGVDATPEAVAAWRKTVGAPDRPEGYLGDAKTLKPESLPDSLWNSESEKGFLAVAHKHSIPPAAVKDILNYYGETLGAQVKLAEEQRGKLLEAEGQKLRKAWGGEYESNAQMAARVAQTIGLDPMTHPAFADAEVVQAFAKMGRLLSEDKLVAGKSNGINGAVSDRMHEITDPKSQSTVAREYRGEFGQERQSAAQNILHDLMRAASQQKR